MSIHPHGDVKKYWQGCRDQPCREANNAYVAEKRAVKRLAASPFPDALMWRIERPARGTVSHYNSFGSVRKAIYGIAKATPGFVGETLAIDYFSAGYSYNWKQAWLIEAGTRVEDLPWRLS